ncbi:MULTISPECIES: glycosyltransferase [unclassified Frankia]|uniref:glycosyltransferase n=1 Tax=unclassified Frankia TaxID=2632575 RepID=UPI0020249D39
MKIVQAANFVAPRSGGIRTTLRHLAAGYTAAGHDVVQILPGERDGVRHTPDATVITMRAPLVPGTDYRVLAEPWRVARLLAAEAPDRLEVHDRATLRPLGRWARRAGVGSVVVSHERLDRLLNLWTPRPLRGVLPVRAAADRSNAALARSFDTVVATTAWAGEEFRRVGATNLRRIPLGVDLDRFRPDRYDTSLRRAFARDSEVLLVHASRLSPEKRGDTAVDALAELVRRGVPARLVIAGDGPSRGRLTRRAAGLPVIFLGFVADRDRLASLLATADVLLAPGPVETFGLAALESMASATPVVVHHGSALAELVVPGAGVVAAGSGWTFADGVEDLLARDPFSRRQAARARAEQFPWQVTVDGFLAAHGLGPAAGRPGQHPARRQPADGRDRGAGRAA